jgi:hypothetical protein
MAKTPEGTYKCECGKEFLKSQSINAHYSRCKVHRGEKYVARSNDPFKNLSILERQAIYEKRDLHKRLRCDDNYYICPTYGREVPLSFFGKCKIHNDPVWFPTRLSVFNKYIQCSKWVIPSQGRHLCVYAEFNDAATHAARYHKFDTSLVVKVQNWHAISMLIKYGRAYLPYIRPEIIKEVRKIVPALGCTWEQSKASNVWSYSIIHADTQKK